MLTEYFTKEEIHEILDDKENIIGVDIITYKYLKTPNPKNLITSNTFTVNVKHRIIIEGSGWNRSQRNQEEGFRHYPIMLGVQTGIKEISDANSKILLTKVFPKTINASVRQTSNQSDGTNKTQINHSSSGSSTSNVNTFGVQISGGMFGPVPTGSLGLDYSHSWENGSSRSSTTGRDDSRNHQAVSGEEMSVKDWSAFCAATNFDDKANSGFEGQVVTWDWGQTYPWNVFDFNENGSGSSIVLPEDVVSRLLYFGVTDDGSEKNILQPPSELSVFGLDFTMVAEWQITFPESISAIEKLAFKHKVSILHGSHYMTISKPTEKGTLTANLSQGKENEFEQSDAVDMGKYALVPILTEELNGGAIGFKEHLFDIAPKEGKGFKILSKRNNLLVTGSGFTSVMSANFEVGYAGSGAALTISFKIVDLKIEYSLVFHHWKGVGSGNIVLKCKVNNDWETIINVDDVEGDGGSNNIDQIELRNFELKSVNFHDYLILGMNTIKVSIIPADNTLASEYIISALGIEG